MRPLRPTRGFTLIELLVVIAIIGILSAVVLGSLVLGRLKAADAAIKADLHTIQSQMEYYYSNNNNTYGSQQGCQPSPSTTVGGSSVFNTDPTIKGALIAALAQAGQGGYWAVGQNGNSYAVAIPLKADSTYWWCVDSSGSPKKEVAATFSTLGTNALHGSGATDASCP